MYIFYIAFFIILFAVLAYRKWSPILLGPTISLFLCIVSGLSPLKTLLGPYMEISSDYVKNFFFIFLLGAIFGVVMEVTNGAKSIATAITKLIGGRFVLPLIMTITGLLVFGGVSGFVVYFAMYPIALHLCRESNTSRVLIPAAIGSGCWTWALTAPGTPSVPQITVMKTFGTSATADLFAGALFAGVMNYVLVFLYLELTARKFRAKGKGFEGDELVNEQLLKSDEKICPKWYIAILPIVVLMVLFNIFGVQIEYCLLITIIVAMIVMYKNGGKLSEWLQTFNKGANSAAITILNTAMVVGFAGVMSSTFWFKDFLSGLNSLNLPPLVYVAVTTTLCGVVAASSSGGVGIALSVFKDTYLSFGLPLDVLSRTTVIASGVFSALPQTGGQITLLNITKQTHKDSYAYMFVALDIIPAIVLIGYIIFHSI